MKTKNQSIQNKHSEQNLSLKETGIVHQQYSGPIPSPQALEKYEQICPGSAHRILTMAENQANHRIALETSLNSTTEMTQKNIVNYFGRGQLFAFFLCLLALVTGFILAYTDKQIVGTIFGGAGLALIVYSFLHSSAKWLK